MDTQETSSTRTARPLRCNHCGRTINLFDGGIAIECEYFYHLDCYVEKHNKEDKPCDT